MGNPAQGLGGPEPQRHRNGPLTRTWRFLSRIPKGVKFSPETHCAPIVFLYQKKALNVASKLVASFSAASSFSSHLSSHQRTPSSHVSISVRDRTKLSFLAK